jgi:lipid II:glycine glycyltransferase (peptidoglycan interpeptide bridge formation enzyme)
VITLFVRQNPLIDSSWTFSSMAEVQSLGPTVAVDLRQPEEEQRRQIRENHRRDIRRARREGVVVREDPDFRRIDLFRKIYIETMDHAQAAEYYYFPRHYFTDLKEQLGDAAKLCFAEQEGNVVSGALFLVTGDIIQYHLGGRAAAFRGCRGSIKLIFDEVRAWGIRNGCRWLHLGGGRGAQEDSLFDFKAGFSRLRFSFQTARLVCRAETYRHLVDRRQRWLDRNGCVGSPGEYFPAYRKRPRTARAA